MTYYMCMDVLVLRATQDDKNSVYGRYFNAFLWKKR